MAKRQNMHTRCTEASPERQHWRSACCVTRWKAGGGVARWRGWWGGGPHARATLAQPANAPILSHVAAWRQQRRRPSRQHVRRRAVPPGVFADEASMQHARGRGRGWWSMRRCRCGHACCCVHAYAPCCCGAPSVHMRARVPPPPPPRAQYAGEDPDLPTIMHLIDNELSEPYSIFTYRYFLQNWPNLSFLAYDGDRCGRACGSPSLQQQQWQQAGKLIHAGMRGRARGRAWRGAVQTVLDPLLQCPPPPAAGPSGL